MIETINSLAPYNTMFHRVRDYNSDALCRMQVRRRCCLLVTDRLSVCLSVYHRHR